MAQKKSFKPTLAFKFSLLVMAGTGLIFISAFAYSNHVARGLLLRLVESNTRNLTRNTAARIQTALSAVEPIPEYAAQTMALESQRPETSRLFLESALKVNPDIYGAAMAFEPGVMTQSNQLFCPYVCRKDKGVDYQDLGTGSYGYLQKEWYRGARKTGKACWTEPYFDDGGGNVLMCTYCVPFFQKSGNQPVFAGVATADVPLSRLAQIVSAIKPYQTGFACLVAPSGPFIAHTDTNLVFKGDIFSLVEKYQSDIITDVGKKMTGGEEGFVRIDPPGEETLAWFIYAPVGDTGWSVGISFPEREILADLHFVRIVVACIGAGGLSMLLLCVFALASGVTSPLRLLVRHVQRISKGDLQQPLPAFRSRDEVGDMARAFENMRVSLNDYIATLARTTAEKERYESELKIAQSIQRSFLPRAFVSNSKCPNLMLGAHLQPARDVGGDLYDHFFLDDESLFFAIGDVSGKGVPAALFMAVTKTLMKSVAMQGGMPSEILERVNRELCEENDEMMFVSMFCGILNIRTGEFQYSNAGHLPPLWLRSGGEVAMLDVPQGPVLGVNEDPAYKTISCSWRTGDRLLLYTDGVTEAMNPAKEFFGDQRLHDFAMGHCGSAPVELVEQLFSEIQRFTQSAPQADDICVLAVSLSEEITRE